MSTDPELKALQETWSAIPGGQGYYVKVYRVNEQNPKGLGRVMLVIKDPETIEDWEVALEEIGQQKGWPSGVYTLVMAQHGKRGGFAKGFPKVEIELDFPEAAGHEKDSWPVVRTGLGIMKDAAEVMTAFGLKGQQSSIAEIGGLMNASFSNGMQANAQMTAAMAQLSAVLGTLMERLVKAEPPKAPDPVDQILRLRQAGLLPETTGRERDDDETPLGPVEQIQQFAQVLDAARPYLLAASGRAPATGWMDRLSSVLGVPSVGRALERLASGVADLGAAAKIRAMGAQGLIQPALPSASESPPEVGRLDSRLAQAIRTNDVTYFPRLATLLHDAGADQLLQAIGTGQVSAEQAWSTIQSSQLPEMTLPDAAAYVQRFCAWVKSQTPAAGNGQSVSATVSEAEGSPPVITVICQKCGADDTEYATVEEFEASPKRCLMWEGEPDEEGRVKLCYGLQTLASRP